MAIELSQSGRRPGLWHRISELASALFDAGAPRATTRIEPRLKTNAKATEDALVALILACQSAEPPKATEPAASAAPSSPAAPAAAAPKSPEPAASEPTAVPFFRVQGVAADDALNVRSDPRAGRLNRARAS